MYNAANTNRNKKLKTMKQVPRNIASRKNYFVEVLAYLYKTQCVTFVLTKQQITLRHTKGELLLRLEE